MSEKDISVAAGAAHIAAGHTPGPWLAAAGPSSVVGWPIVGPGGRSICRLWWFPRPADASETDWQAFTDECEANGRLIAAAPDLLDALKAIVALDDGDAPDLWHWEREFAAARDAIAKAEGK